MLAAEREAKAKELKEAASKLDDMAKLEDFTVRQVDYWKGSKNYQGGSHPGERVIRSERFTWAATGRSGARRPWGRQGTKSRKSGKQEDAIGKGQRSPIYFRNP